MQNFIIFFNILKYVFWIEESYALGSRIEFPASNILFKKMEAKPYLITLLRRALRFVTRLKLGEKKITLAI
jgi:hypothetical protein